MTDNQIFILLGIFYLSVSLSMFFNPQYFRRFFESFFNEPLAVFVSGIIALIAGYILIIYHNMWEFSKTVIITIFGWLALAKGVLILAMPELFIRISSKILIQNQTLHPFRIVCVFLGLVFMLLAFI